MDTWQSVYTMGYAILSRHPPLPRSTATSSSSAPAPAAEVTAAQSPSRQLLAARLLRCLALAAAVLCPAEAPNPGVTIDRCQTLAAMRLQHLLEALLLST